TPVFVVESIPVEEGSPYARRVQHVDGARWVVTQVEYYRPEDRLLKTLEARWQEVDGIWAWE
ncbi:MAG: outer membrane lipoprotein-sorting protein, partial [Gammaproteobacteria bacterium]|nr:outer membrane lipoprotein-sorting protein [Gammaproteobacteria bacterium]